MIGIGDDSPSGAFLPLVCNNCEVLILAWGDMEAVASHEEPMGPDVTHSWKHWADCPNCGQEIEVTYDFSEYPQGTLQPTDIVEQRGASPLPLLGFAQIASDVGRRESALDKLGEELDGIEEMIRAGALIEATEIRKDVARALSILRDATKGAVLLLGPYKSMPGLRRVESELKRLGLKPVIVSDTEGAAHHDISQKSEALLQLVPFAIMLDDFPGGQLIEFHMIAQKRVVLAQLLPGGKPSSQMQGDVSEFPFIKRFAYGADPVPVVHEAVEWAKAYLKEREARLAGQPEAT